MRALMVTGYQWDVTGKAVLSLAIVGLVLQSVTLGLSASSPVDR